MPENLNAKRVNRANSKLKRSGGSVLNGVRLQPESNIYLFKLTTSLGLSRTEIVNRAIVYYGEKQEVDNKSKKQS